MPLVPFGPFTPDEPAFGGLGAREAQGVIPEKAGYRPFKDLVPTSNALSARAQGAAWFRRSDSTTAVFAGDATKLYLFAANVWSDVSRLAGGAYATPSDGSWRFGQFGTLAYATNGFDVLQSFDLSAGLNWIDAIGSPPIGRFITTIRNFLVLGNVVSLPQRVAWAGANNPGTWAPSATTLADAQDQPDGGAITGLVGGEFGLVFQENAIRRMTFEGSPTVFRFDRIASDLGATIPNSVAGWGPLAFFCHRSGFHMIRGGQEIVAIGDDKIDRWFWEKVDEANLHRVSSAVDPVNHLYIVAFPSLQDSSGNPTMALIYNWKADRWSYVYLMQTELVFAGAVQQAYTLEQLDAFGNLDALPYSLDASYWTGIRQLFLAGFSTSHTSGAFSGPNHAVIIDTAEMQPTPGRRSRIFAARPMFDGAVPTLTVGQRDTQQAPITWRTETAMTPSGRCPVRGAGRYVRFRARTVAGEDYTFAQGIDDIEAAPQGRR